MRPRFQADADFNQKIVLGVRRREAVVDFEDAHAAGVIGLPDPDVLKRAAGLGRTLISHLDIGLAIEDLLIIWAASEAEEWRNTVGFLPL